MRKITDNRKFSNTVKPFLSNKGTTSQKISLKEKEEIVTADIKISDVLDEHFMNSVRQEKVAAARQVLKMNDEREQLDDNITRFKYHPSIVNIKSKVFCGKFLLPFYLQMTFYLN